MRGGSASTVRLRRSGRAGLIATFAIALLGVGLGVVSAYVSEYGSAARAARSSAATASLRDSAMEDWRAREEIVRKVLAGAQPPQRLPAPLLLDEPAARPKVIIIFDDMGLDRRAFEEVLALPGPLTLSFLPYAKDAKSLAAKARQRGNEIMLHLPMQPKGHADPGPHALTSEMTGGDFIKAIEWNLDRFEGYVAVNNHMGSKLTTDEAAMKTLLAYLKERNLFFIDSVTTGQTLARSAGALVGATVFSRDVFLDDPAHDAGAVRRQLGLLERVARETGYVIAICHPRRETLDVIGPWLATAPARGFDLVSVSALPEVVHGRELSPLVAAAPELRL